MLLQPNNSENASNANQDIDFEEAADDSQVSNFFTVVTFMNL